MYGKILLKCDLVVLTGMHIGGSSTFSAIGAVDKPVVRDARAPRAEGGGRSEPQHRPPQRGPTPRPP